MTRKAPGSKTNDKKRTALTKRRYRGRVIAQPIPTTPTPTTPVNSTALTPTVVTSSTQIPKVMSTATSILITVYNLAKGKFSEIPCPTGRPQTKENPSILNSNLLPLEDIPNALVRDATPCPSTGSVSENLSTARKDWPTPPTPVPTLKTEAPPQVAVIPHAMVMPKQVVEKCSWGLHCHICKYEEEHREEDWDSNRERMPHQ